MLLRDFLPNPALKEFVQLYRIVHFEFDNCLQIPFKAYPPKPEQCLYFILRDPLTIEFSNSPKRSHLPPIVVIGQQTLVNRRYFKNSFLNFQIVFQPTGLFRLTGIPSFELTNQFVDAENIFGNGIRLIQEALQLAKSYREMLVIADRYVADLINHARREAHLLDSVSQVMMERDGGISLNWLAKESCLCGKQFQRKFNERAGVNPKTYSRIIRFVRAFNTKNAHPDWDWLRIAVGCNYFDYQHLVKDYKDLTGSTPNEFHILENNSPESRLGLTDELYRARI
jgi:AraC-like DNA-binding protein